MYAACDYVHAPVFKKSGVMEVVYMHLCSRRVE